MRQVTQLVPSDLQNGVLYFGSLAHCKPCATLHPLLSELSDEMPELQFLHIDVEDSPELTLEYRVRSIPTVYLYINGQKKEEFFGLKSRQDYSTAFAEYLTEREVA